MRSKYVLVVAGTVLATAVQSPVAFGEAQADSQICVQHSEVVSRVGQVITLRPTSVDCYANDAAKRTAVAAAGASLVAKATDGAGFAGAVLEFEVPSDSGCLGNTTWQWTEITSSWKNRISSFRATYTYCDKGILYDYNNFRGAQFICASICGSLGAMNNATNSLRVYDY